MAILARALLLILALPAAAGLIATLWLGVDLAAWQTLLTTPGLWRALGRSLWTGVLASGLSVGLAHLIVALASTAHWRGRLRSTVIPLLALPHLAVAIGLALALAPSGLILRLLSPWATGFHQPPDWFTVQDPWGIALILGLAIKETPFLVLMLLGALAQTPADLLLLQSRTLGYGRLKAWLTAVAPLLQRQIPWPMAAVLVFGLTNVDMAIALGPATPPTLAVLLWQWLYAGDLAQQPVAYAGSLLLLLATLGMLGLSRQALQLAGTVLTRLSWQGRRATADRGVRAMISGSAMLGLVLTASAVGALALRGASTLWRFPAVLPPEFNGGLFAQLAPTLVAPTRTTVLLAALTGLLSVALALIAAEAVAADSRRRQRWGAVLFLPLLLPQLAFLFGLQWLLLRLTLDGSFLAVLWAHVTLALPYVFGILASARAALDPRLMLSARVLGASRVRVWWTVTAPLLARAMLLAFSIAFAVSTALYLPTLFAGGGRIVTVATEAASAVSGGQLGIAAVYGALQAVAPCLALLLAALISHRLYRDRRGVPT